MTRLRADALLLFAAIIWGSTFLVQKTASASIGPLWFIGLRFLISAAVVAPFALSEHRRSAAPPDGLALAMGGIVGLALFAGSALQQVGIAGTSITNAGFLTALYVVLVPAMAWLLLAHAPDAWIWPAAFAALSGAWLLAGGALTRLSAGDALVLAGAVVWAFHVVIVGLAVTRTGRPLAISCAQFAITGLLGITAGIALEPISFAAVAGAWLEILYAGVLSGGVAYTLQVVAQRHTPPADAAIILSTEAVFAAIAGALFLGERLTMAGWLGCGLILSAVLAVELLPLTRARRTR